MELKFSHTLSTEHFTHRDVLVPWAEAIELGTGGRIRIAIYPESSLFKTPEIYGALISGKTDAALCSLGYLPEHFPLTSVLFLPYVSSLPARSVTGIYNELYEMFPQMKKEYDRIKCLWFMTHGPTVLMSKRRPIRMLENLKNMSVRANGLLARVVAQMEGKPVPMAAPDINGAMGKGEIEAMFVPLEALLSYNLYEHTKYITIGTASLYGAICVGMHLDVWNSLPRDIQMVIEEESVKASDINIRGWDQEDDKAIEFARSKGLEIIYLSSEEIERWKEKIRPLWDRWISETEAKGFPGRAIMEETLRLFEKYRERDNKNFSL